VTDSHGGADHYVVTDQNEVDRLLERDVAASDRQMFRAELDAAAPYVTDRPALRARIQLAMLFVAKGDVEKLRRARELADVDWRDLLMQAEYPSTPPYGTEETPEQKRMRQQRDVDSMTEWRRRS